MAKNSINLSFPSNSIKAGEAKMINAALVKAAMKEIVSTTDLQTPISSALYGLGLKVSLHSFHASTLISMTNSISARRGVNGKAAQNSTTYPY